MKSPSRRFLAALAATVFAVLAIAGPASAHVTVNPDTAPRGAYTKLTFRVPTESDTASTTKVQVQLPADHPLASVSVKPHAGWTFTVTRTKLAHPIKSDDGEVTEAVSEISWTAASPAARIRPGEFDEFDISVGPLPDAASMTFKALQTYSDGTVVRWIETSTGEAEPEHPAPVLSLTPAASSDDPAASTTSTTPSTTENKTTDSGDGKTDVALTLSIIALVLAAGGAVVAVAGRRQRAS